MKIGYTDFGKVKFIIPHPGALREHLSGNNHTTVYKNQGYSSDYVYTLQQGIL